MLLVLVHRGWGAASPHDTTAAGVVENYLPKRPLCVGWEVLPRISNLVLCEGPVGCEKLRSPNLEGVCWEIGVNWFLLFLKGNNSLLEIPHPYSRRK